MQLLSFIMSHQHLMCAKKVAALSTVQRNSETMLLPPTRIVCTPYRTSSERMTISFLPLRNEIDWASLEYYSNVIHGVSTGSTLFPSLAKKISNVDFIAFGPATSKYCTLQKQQHNYQQHQHIIIVLTKALHLAVQWSIALLIIICCSSSPSSANSPSTYDSKQ